MRRWDQWPSYILLCISPTDIQPIARHISEAIHCSLTTAAWMSPMESLEGPSSRSQPKCWPMEFWAKGMAAILRQYVCGDMLHNKKWQIEGWRWLIGKSYSQMLEKRRVFLSSCCTSSLDQALMYIFSPLVLMLGICYFHCEVDIVIILIL